MLNGMRFLIAEDFEDTRDLLKAIFEMKGARVVTADNGLEALVHARLEPFHAILMDLDMPELDGLEAAHRLRKSGYDGLVIALSAGLESAVGWPSADFSFAVQKPLSAEDFVRIHTEVSRISCASPRLMASAVAKDLDQQPALRSRFLESLPLQEQRLEALLQEGRFEDIRELAHKLRGIGTMVGFPEITEAGAAVESGSADGHVLLDIIRRVYHSIAEPLREERT